MNPSVSVIIPTYNREKTLFKAIKSVVEQTYKGRIRVIVVDDSKKSIEKELKDVFDGFVTYIHNANPRGSPAARNIGYEFVDSDYLCLLDDDDTWHPTKLQEQMREMRENPDCPLVVCWALDKRFGMERVNKPPKIITHEMMRKSFNLSSSSSYLMRVKSIKELDCFFDETLLASQEYDLAIRLTESGHEARCVQKVLTVQNATEGQISVNWKRKIKGVVAIYRKHNTSLIKTLGLCIMFAFGCVFGYRIYKILIPIKKRYENTGNTLANFVSLLTPL